jgi:transposase
MAVAQQFGVSRGWAWKISAQRKSNGQIEHKQFTPGPKSRLDRALAAIVASQPDATLPEIQAELERRSQLRLCTVYIWRVLGKMGFRLDDYPVSSGIRFSRSSRSLLCNRA